MGDVTTTFALAQLPDDSFASANPVVNRSDITDPALFNPGTSIADSPVRTPGRIKEQEFGRLSPSPIRQLEGITPLPLTEPSRTPPARRSLTYSTSTPTGIRPKKRTAAPATSSRQPEVGKRLILRYQDEG